MFLVSTAIVMVASFIDALVLMLVLGSVHHGAPSVSALSYWACYWLCLAVAFIVQTGAGACLTVRGVGKS